MTAEAFLYALEVSRDAQGVVDPQIARLAIDSVITVRGTGMVAQKPTAATAGALNSPEHVGQITRVITSSGHCLCPENVRFCFVLTTELQKIRPDRELSPLTDHRARRPTKDCASNT